MSFATITGGGSGGRYTIQLDYGEGTRAVTVAAFEERISQLNALIAEVQLDLDSLAIVQAEYAQAMAAAIQAYIDSGGAGGSSATANKAAQELIDRERKRYIESQRLVMSARIQHAELMLAKSQTVDMRNRWQALDLTQEKQVWCVDLTENGSGTVAAIDINGDTDLTLLAPGCRPWQPGDGLVSTERKNAAIDQIERRIEELEHSLLVNDEETYKAEEAALQAKVELEEAYIQYRVSEGVQRDRLGEEIRRLTQDVQDITREVTRLKSRKSELQLRIQQENVSLDKWRARPDTAAPYAGDGDMLSSAVMAPHQSFFNLAILPGWQRHMPTYRWGTITALDKDADTADVNLAPATSSAQNLNINEVSSLTNVPVVYMTCNAKAFEVGDRVVVQFLNQDWNKPQVIGFLDNPKPCQLFTATYRMIGNTSFNDGALTLIQEIERYKDEAWGPVVAPEPTSVQKFLGWSDGVGSLYRDDGNATANIAPRAQYTYAPNFRCFLYVSYAAEEDAIILPPEGDPYKIISFYVFVGKQWYAQGLLGQEARTPLRTDETILAWRGRATLGTNADNAAEMLIGQIPNVGLEWSGPPIQIPNKPSSTETVTFQLPGSDNVYTVTGDVTNNPFPVIGGQQIPPGGGFGDYLYTATSWSAEYFE